MALRFHESLSAQISAALDCGLDLASTVFLRDGRGRLVAACKEVTNFQLAEKALRDALGGYASPVALVTGSPAERLAQDAACVLVTVQLNNGLSATVKYIDRRIVGADWLRSPAGAPATPPRLVFGSLKGGVGRSTALSVLAADLARAGKSVLAIDLDIDSPGIGFLLLPQGTDNDEDRRPMFGVVDYLVENSLGGVSDEDLIEFVGTSPFGVAGSIDVIPATGRLTDEHPASMLSKLSIALVEDKSPAHTKTLSDQIVELLARFTARRQYDAVLIDARAGMGEVSAAPLISLKAELLLFGTDQQQTFRGYTYLLAHLVSVTDFQNLAEGADWRERLSFVHSKAPSLARARVRFRDRLYEMLGSYVYDIETEQGSGEIFAPAPNDIGLGIPHDATFIRDASDSFGQFDPTIDDAALDPELYEIVFGDYLRRSWSLLGMTRDR